MSSNVLDLDSAVSTQNNAKRIGVNDKRSEILYNGYHYDVTDFLPRHPGGNVIRFYINEGEDATQAIDQFHFRAKDKLAAIMQGFNKRMENLDGHQIEPSLRRHEELNADFQKLFEELQTEGFFNPSYQEVILRLLECTSLLILSFGIFFKYEVIAAKLFATVLVGFAYSRHGWLMHEAGHNSLTGNPKADKILQYYMQVVVLGGSASWWNSQHNRHHAMPQRLQHDVDLSTLPYVAFHERTVQDKKEISKFFVKHQAIWYWTLDPLIAFVAWKFFIHPKYLLQKKKYGELLLMIPSCLVLMYVGPHYYFLTAYWLALCLGINFALSHSHLDVTDKPTHWVEYALTHTVNITPNMFVDYWMGYLNYQIEHHLFPTMPQFRQRQITHRVRALAEKHGLPYRVLTYTEACNLAVKNLYKVGQILTSKY